MFIVVIKNHTTGRQISSVHFIRNIPIRSHYYYYYYYYKLLVSYYYYYYICSLSRDSTVGIETYYGLVDRGVGVRYPVG
jgi:hypothetical protein